MEAPCDGGEGLCWHSSPLPGDLGRTLPPNFFMSGWQGAAVKYVFQGHSNSLKLFQFASASRCMFTVSIWLALSNIFV